MNLVLCIDGAQPQRELWQRLLPRHVEDWSGVAAGGTQRCLPFDRVLLLLTRIDQFCAVACNSAQRQRGKALKAFASIKPEALVTRLDPAQQVRAVVGDDVIARLLTALKPTALVAAGLVSAVGFGAAPGTAHAIPPWNASSWQPLGVREAFRFLDGGASSFPLAPLTADDLKRELTMLAR